MPLIQREDFALGDETSRFCVHCTDAEGRVRSCEEIFEGGVQFFMGEIGIDRTKAERVTRKNMLQLPYWRGNDSPVLQGETATDEEFAEVLSMLG